MKINNRLSRLIVLAVCAKAFAAVFAHADSETSDLSASLFARRLPWGRCTQKVSGDVTKLYLHVFDWPADGQLFVPGLKSKVQKAYLLADRSQQKLATKKGKEGMQVKLPANATKGISTTVVLEIKGAV